MVEKWLNNAAKESVSEIINEKDNEMDDAIVDRINMLHEQDLLKDIEIMEETKEVYYPKRSDTV